MTVTLYSPGVSPVKSWVDALNVPSPVFVQAIVYAGVPPLTVKSILPSSSPKQLISDFVPVTDNTEGAAIV